MKPGGLCSPTDGSSMPSGDTINSLSTHKSPDKGERHSESSSASAEHASFSAQLAEGHQQLTHAPKGHANGMLPHEDLPNGMYAHSKSPPMPRHVLLPLHGEDHQGKGSAPGTASQGKEESNAVGSTEIQRLSVPVTASASSSSPFPHSLSNACNKSFHQLTVITSPTGYSSKCTAPNDTSRPSPGGHSVSPKFMSPGQSVSPKGVCLTSPKSLKSPKGRRKFSLEEMVTKLHNRTESFQSGFSVLPFPSKSVLGSEGAVKNNADVIDRKASLLVTGNLSEAKTPCQSGFSPQNICDNNNTARICDAHPAVNPSVNDACIRLQNEDTQCTNSASLPDCNAKTIVDTSEKTIASEELNVNTKVPVLHLDDGFQSEQGVVEGKPKENCSESSLSLIGEGRKDESSSECDELTRNAQCGTLLKECSSKDEVQQGTNQVTSENVEISQVCKTDVPSTSSTYKDSKTVQQLVSCDLQGTETSENNQSSLLEMGTDVQPVVSNICQKQCEDRNNKVEERTKGENLDTQNVSKTLEKENAEVTAPSVCQMGEVIVNEQISNNECKSHSSDSAVQREQAQKGNPNEKTELCEHGDIEIACDQSEVRASDKSNEQSENVEQGSELRVRVPVEQQCESVVRSDCQKDMESVSRQGIINKFIDLTAESESVRSSSVEILETESIDNADSESEIEILYEKKDERNDEAGKNLPSGETSNAEKSQEASSYLEPISDDENSLLCDPSTSSGLSSVSGFQSNSDTPMFSDTPSDASRGAIMVRISDAVAALLSDVSDASLPDSPLSYSDKTQDSSEKADEVIPSNTSEETYANNHMLQARAVVNTSSGESTKDFKGILDTDLKENMSSSASIVENDANEDNSKGEQGPRNIELDEKEDPIEQNSSVIESIERIFEESLESGSNICRLASSTSGELCSNSNQAMQVQNIASNDACRGKEHLEQSTPSGEASNQSGDGSSTSTATHGITPTGQFSQLPGLSEDKLDSNSSHSQVPASEFGTIACSSLNDSSHICQNLISGSLNSSSQNQNCNISQNGSNTQSSAIVHDGPGSEELGTFPDKQISNTQLSDNTAQESLPTDAITLPSESEPLPSEDHSKNMFSLEASDSINDGKYMAANDSKTKDHSPDKSDRSDVFLNSQTSEVGKDKSLGECSLSESASRFSQECDQIDSTHCHTNTSISSSPQKIDTYQICTEIDSKTGESDTDTVDTASQIETAIGLDQNMKEDSELPLEVTDGQTNVAKDSLPQHFVDTGASPAQGKAAVETDESTSGTVLDSSQELLALNELKPQIDESIEETSDDVQSLLESPTVCPTLDITESTEAVTINTECNQAKVETPESGEATTENIECSHVTSKVYDVSDITDASEAASEETKLDSSYKTVDVQNYEATSETSAAGIAESTQEPTETELICKETHGIALTDSEDIQSKPVCNSSSVTENTCISVSDLDTGQTANDACNEITESNQTVEEPETPTESMSNKVSHEDTTGIEDKRKSQENIERESLPGHLCASTEKVGQTPLEAGDSNDASHATETRSEIELMNDDHPMENTDSTICHSAAKNETVEGLCTAFISHNSQSDSNQEVRSTDAVDMETEECFPLSTSEDKSVVPEKLVIEHENTPHDQVAMGVLGDNLQTANIAEGINTVLESSFGNQSTVESKVVDDNLHVNESLESIHTSVTENETTAEILEHDHSQNESGQVIDAPSDVFESQETLLDIKNTDPQVNVELAEDHTQVTKSSPSDTAITENKEQDNFQEDTPALLPSQGNEEDEKCHTYEECLPSLEVGDCGDEDQVCSQLATTVDSGKQQTQGNVDYYEDQKEEQSIENIKSEVVHTDHSSDNSQSQQTCQVAQSDVDNHQQSIVGGSSSSSYSAAVVLEDKNAGEADMKPEPEFLGILCPLCMEMFNEPLDVHLLEFHICNYFIPAKRTQAFKLHMLKRTQDFSHDELEAIDTQEFVYVCQSCQFASKDINAVRFHINIHENVYQANPGKVSCECNEKKFSYPFHKWKHLLHRSTYQCNVCLFYFSCENGLLNHLKALHFSGANCKNCNIEVSEDILLTHKCPIESKDGEDNAEGNPEEPSLDKFELSWNIYDNYVNYLDGKDFRLNTSPKVLDPNLDRSYLKLPIKNVLDEAVVPDEVKLDPGKDIGKYLKGKKNVKLTLDDESYGIVKNFTLTVQIELEKRLTRKGRRGQAAAPRAKREDDLFDVLGIGTIRSRGASKQEIVEPAASLRSKKGRGKNKQETRKEGSESHGQEPSLTRTRSGMQPVREESEKLEETPTPAPESLAKQGIMIDGEWTKNHTYICCSCGAGYLDLADMMDHKWESHPSVWCAHTMIQGQEEVPASFCKQYQPPTSQPHKLPLPGTSLKQTPSRTPSRRNSDANTPTPAEKTQDVCSLCKLEFQDRTLFHAHLVECGGLNYVATSKKNKKKGFRFKRRKGQGVPSNRYGNSSQPGTPLKAKPGDRSSGLNTPQLDKVTQSTVQSSGVKRRLELAVGSIDNAELKNRLKAIITGAKKTTSNATSSRRTRMKLRKKALEMKRLRKTRHSDRVKENVFKQSDKGKDEGGKEKDKKLKEETGKIPGKKGKEDSVKEEEKEEENALKNVGRKAKGSSGGKIVKEGNESSGKSGEKKEKAASGKSIKYDSGDGEIENPKKIMKRRGSGEKVSKQPKGTIEKGNVGRKKQLKASGIEPVTETNELSTKSTSEIADIVSNTKMAKKSKHGYGEKKLQSLKKMNGVLGLSNKDLSPVSSMKGVKGKSKMRGGKVGRKPVIPISGEVTSEQSSHKKMSVFQSNEQVSDNLQRSIGAPTNKKIKGQRTSVDSATGKVSKSISKKKNDPDLGMEKETEATYMSLAPEDVKQLTAEKNLIKYKKIKEKKVYMSKKDVLDLEGAKINLDEEIKYKTAKVQESEREFESEDSRDVVKMNMYPSSGEETEDDSDSEPEISHNFRTGRRCGGRMGLRSKRMHQNTRYSFRSCLNATDGENEDSEAKDSRETVASIASTEDVRDELPLTPKRKRKIANYENDDDFTYMPSGNSTDLEEESSDGVQEPDVTSFTLRKRRKMVIPSSDSEAGKPARRILQRRGSSLTSDGDTFDDSYDEGTLKNTKNLPIDNSEEHVERRITKKKNLRLHTLVSQSVKNHEKLGSKLSKKTRQPNENKISVLGSSEDEKVRKVRKYANITDDSQESESTADDDYLGKMPLINLPSKRKKTMKKSVATAIPPSDTKLNDSSQRSDDDDDDDNIPLATIAQLKGQSLPRRIAMSNIIKEKVRGMTGRSKNLIGLKKHLPLKTLARQVKDAGTADSESSGFEGFAPVSLKKNKRRIGMKYKTKNSISQAKTIVPQVVSENDIETSSNTELSSSPKPKRKCTVSKKIENNATEILVSKSIKDSKIFNADSDVEDKTMSANTQTAANDLGSSPLKSDVPKPRKYVRKSTETISGVPVLDANVQEPGSEPLSTDTGDVLSSSEDANGSQKQPAKVRRRRSSVEKIKDIPTRSSSMLLQENQTPELKVVLTDDKISDTSSSANITEKPVPLWESKKPVISEPRKRRTKSSHELMPQSESTVKVPDSIHNENEVISSVEEAQALNVPKKTKRKRAVSMSGVPAVAEKGMNLKSPLRVGMEGVSKNTSAKSPKKNADSQKRKKNANKDDMNDLKCVDCGLRFGSFASLEDHQQDCVTIAFEMSLMEAEDHLFECPHCHLTFALKGTQRKHTTSCRMAKSKKNPHRNDLKAMKRANRTAVPRDVELPNTADSSIVGGPGQGAQIKSRRRSKENVASDDGMNAASPLKDSCKQNFVTVSEVVDKSDPEKQTEKTKKVSPTPYSRNNSKVRKELQTNGQLEKFEGVDVFCLTKIDGVQKCLVCGHEVTDKESCDKHQLLQQFTRHCEQKTVVEVCALLTNYNLGIDTVRTLITSASILHGSTVINLDAKQQSYPESNAVLTSSCAVQLKELLTSPHCTWIVSVLDTITSQQRTSKTVSISGTRQEALKAVTALEELLKEISEIENSIKKNQMLKSMRETFEAGT